MPGPKHVDPETFRKYVEVMESMQVQLDQVQSQIAEGIQIKLDTMQGNITKLGDRLSEIVRKVEVTSPSSADGQELSKNIPVEPQKYGSGSREPHVQGTAVENVQVARLSQETEVDDDEGRPSQKKRVTSASAASGKISFRSMLSQGKTDHYGFEDGIWELSLFLCVPQLGGATSVFLMGVLFTQICVQVGLVCIINESFTESNIDEAVVRGLHKWRVYNGHSFSLADSVSFEPLAKRICSGDASIPFSYGVQAIINDITEYIPSESDYYDASPMFGHLVVYTENIGIILCELCIAIWLMIIISSLGRQWRLLRAINALPQEHGVACIHVDADNALTLKAMGARRKVWCFVLITIQLLVEIFLGVMGVAYMIFTISLRDLLLNCSALLIVLELDAVFYAAFAPREAKILMDKLQPLPRPQHTVMYGLNWEVVFSVASLIVACICSYAPLRDQADTLKAARENICGGNTDFLTVTNNAGIVTAGEHPPHNTHVEDTYIYRAVSQLIANKATAMQAFSKFGSLSATVGHEMANSFWSLEYQSDVDFSESVSYFNPNCTDMLPASVHPYSPLLLQIVQDAANNRSLHTCQNLRSFCSADTKLGTRSRQFCPITCGCDDAASGLVLSGVIGCPPSCIRSSSYLASIAARNCTDEGNRSAYFRRYVDGLRSMQASYPAQWVTDFPASINKIQDYGCELIPKKIPLSFVGVLWTDLCRESPAQIIALSFACPVSCSCATLDKAGCPSTCQGR